MPLLNEKNALYLGLLAKAPQRNRSLLTKLTGRTAREIGRAIVDPREHEGDDARIIRAASSLRAWARR